MFYIAVSRTKNKRFEKVVWNVKSEFMDGYMNIIGLYLIFNINDNI